MGMLKRCMVFAFCIILCIMSLNGCKGKNEVSSAFDITDEVIGYCDKEIDWTRLNRKDIPVHFGFSADKVTDLSVFVNDADEYYDTVATFTFNSADDLNGVIEALNKSMSSAADTFKNINELEAQKISKRLVLKQENTLVIVVSSNYEKIGEMLNDKGFISVAK